MLKSEALNIVENLIVYCDESIKMSSVNGTANGVANGAPNGDVTEVKKDINADGNACKTGSLMINDLDLMTKDILSAKKNKLAINVLTTNDLLDGAQSRKTLLTQNHVYSVQISNEGKPVTSQKSTGRCWLFAALNVIRIPFMKHYKLDKFEFSQSYLFFWDKFERANYFLEQIIDTVKEPLDGRLVQHLLSKPVEDGGQFDMIVNIVEKYGLCPKTIFPEVKATEASRRINWLINRKLRDFACVLRSAYDTNNSISVEELRKIKMKQIKQIYQIMIINFGVPPKAFEFAFRDKDKKYVKLTADSPLDFYNKYVRQFFDVKKHVSLINDPRNEYYKLYTVQRLSNIVAGERPHVLYINLPIDVLKEYSIKLLKDDKPVWFGCDVGKFFSRSNGTMDLDNFDYELIFDIDFTMTKAQRLKYGESLMTHAMVFTGVDLDKSGKSKKWRVENSWGDKHGKDGYCLMTDKWFDEYNFQVCIPIDILDKKIKDVLNQSPTELPPWDPMGSLAK